MKKISQMKINDLLDFIMVNGILTLTAIFGGALFFYPFPPENRDLINMFMIALTGWTTTVVSKRIGENDNAKSRNLTDLEK